MSTWSKIRKGIKKVVSDPKRLLTAVATGGLSEIAYRPLKEAAKYVSGYKALEEMEEAQKKQYSQQLEQMREMSQWGYGYPSEITDTLLEDLKNRAKKSDEYAYLYDRIKEAAKQSGVSSKDYMKSLQARLAEYRGDVESYAQELSVGGTAEAYKELAKLSWNQAFQALTEVPGMTEGQRLAAMATLTNKYGQALIEAGILGEEERVQRAGLKFGARAGYDVTALGATTEAERIKMLLQQDYLNRQYQTAVLGLDVKNMADAAQSQAISAAMGLPSRYPGTITPPMQAPSFGAYIAPALGQAALTAAGYYFGIPSIGAAATTAGGGGTAQFPYNPYGGTYFPQLKLSPNPYGG